MNNPYSPPLAIPDQLDTRGRVATCIILVLGALATASFILLA